MFKLMLINFKWVKVAHSCPTLCDPMDSPWNFPGQNIGVGSRSLLRGIFPTQGSNPGLSHCRLILCQLSHKGSSRMLKWVVYPFSRGSSQPRSRTWLSCVASRFFSRWTTREANKFQDLDQMSSFLRTWIIKSGPTKVNGHIILMIMEEI